MSIPSPGQQRLTHQHLTHGAASQPADVVRSMGAMQAQDYGQSLWAIGSRTDGLTAADITAAIDDGLILRTWPQRGTLHLVPSRDAAWMLQISAARTVAGRATRLGQLELDEPILRRCHALIEKALAGGNRVTRPDLMRLLEDNDIKTGGQRGYTVLWHAAHTGLICVGPMQGKQQTFVLLAEWVADPVLLTRDQGATELARRYFTSHGPATIADFAWWSSLTLTDAKKAVASASDGLLVTSTDGVDHWAAPPAYRRGGIRALLLAGFDEFLLGYQDRSAVLAPQYADKVVPGGNGIFKPTMVLDGQVVGAWQRTVRRGSVAIHLVPFEDLGERDGDAFLLPAERFARFLGLELASVNVAPVGTEA